MTPTRHALRVDAKTYRDRHGRHSLVAAHGARPREAARIELRDATLRDENDLNAFSQPSLERARARQPFKDHPLSWMQLDRRSASTHRPTLILRIGERKFLKLPPARTRLFTLGAVSGFSFEPERALKMRTM